jgi:hypothetical protein
MILEAVATQKLVPTAETVYVPAVETVIEADVAPVFQKYAEPPLAVKTTLVPEHIFVVVEVITGVGKALTVTAIAELVAKQPKEFVTVTVYDPAVVAVYVEPVPTTDDPLLQEYNEPVLAVKTTLPPEQKVVAPPAVIVAVVAAGSVIVTEAVVVHKLASVTVTV